MPALVGSCEGRSDCGDENFYDVGDWMRLESRIFVARAPEVVGRWLGDVSNVAKWDRGVGDARVTSGGAMKVGTEFETVGLPGARDGAGLRGRSGGGFAGEVGVSGGGGGGESVGGGVDEPGGECAIFSEGELGVSD
jgi:hypothetical protein